MELIEHPQYDTLWEGPVLAAADGMRWIAVPMLVNHRLVGVRDGGDGCADWGWCYSSLAAIIAAVHIWDPVTQDEPLGWHKRAGDGTRAPRSGTATPTTTAPDASMAPTSTPASATARPTAPNS